MRKILITFILSTLFIPLLSQVSIFPTGTPWKYLDNGSDQGTAWYGTGFNDASWASGNAQLGYGDGDEATVLSFGGTSSNKYRTYYFRKTFTVASVATYTAYTINLKRDDGVIIYINGTEVYRNNMPSGVPTYTTYASSNCSDDGGSVLTATLPSSVISTGTNVIAAEIHQCDAGSSDVTFELSLTANTNYIIPSIVKGPYLQMGTHNSMLLRWETNVASDSKVCYGTSSSVLSSTVTDAASVTSHSIQITGLTPYTKYYYSIGSTSVTLQGNQDNYFRTSPLPGTAGNYRFWVIGDCGNASTNQTNVKNQYMTYNGPSRITDGWLTLGDNAYSNGSDAQFNAEFFGIYQNDVMKNMVLWPTPGNHDYNNGASTATTVPYYSIFSTPNNAEAGGVPSGTSAYYSYNYGNIHFISLDSYGTVAGNKMYDTTGAQATWLKQDLAANTQRWTIAYWHHPPYTMGSHNSDTESDLVAIRQKFIRILERNKVDLILCGHSHDYERSKLMKGHYGNEASFDAGTHNLSTQSGAYDASANSCPYLKDSLNAKNGTVYVLSGSAGQLGGSQTSFPHNAMHYSNATNGGSLILDIQDNRLDAKWLCADGVIRDKFTVFKDVNSVQTFTVLPSTTQTISASWPGSYLWSDASTNQNIAVSPTTTATYWVKDPNSCVADTFKYKVLPASDFTSTPAYCAGTPVRFSDLSSNSPVTWSWSVTPSAGVTIVNSSVGTPDITFANDGTYSVSLRAGNEFGMGTLVTKTVTIHPNPSVSAAASSGSICSGQTATLTAGGADSYSWNTGESLTAMAVSPTLSATYTVTGTALSGCATSTTIALAVNNNPTVTAVPSVNVICAGQSSTLTASGAASYTWNTGSNSSTLTVSPSSAAAYTVTGTDLNGCASVANTNVSVNALPLLTITAGSTSLCAMQSSSLAASGANTYTWSTSATTGSITVSPSANTTYTVAGTDGNNCQATQTIAIAVHPNPVVLATANPAAICNGQNAALGATGANSYAWSNASTAASISIAPNATSTYTVTGTDLNGCSATSTVTLNVNALPIVNAISTATMVCALKTATLTASGATTYTWNTTATGSSITVSPATHSFYTVTGTDANNCSSSASIALHVNPLPLLTLSSSTASLCASQTATLNVTGATTYTWNTSATSASIAVSPTSNATYTVTGTDANGCSTGTAMTLTVNPKPVITTASSSNTICAGQSATITAGGANTYTWSSTGTGSSITVSPATTTIYSVSATAISGCANTATFTQFVSTCTGIEAILTGSQTSISIYPNPSNGNFSIDLNGTETFHIDVLSTTGQAVYSGELKPGSNTIGLNVANGMYYYSISKDKRFVNQGKIIVQ